MRGPGSPAGRGERGRETEQENGAEGCAFLWGHSASLGAVFYLQSVLLSALEGQGRPEGSGVQGSVWKVPIPKPGGLWVAEFAEFQQHTFTGEIRKKC